MKNINDCSDCDFGGQLWSCEPLFWDYKENDYVYGKDERYFVRCVNNGCGKRTGVKNSAEEVVTKWNLDNPKVEK